MRIVLPQTRLDVGESAESMLKRIERMGRKAYKSEDKIDPESYRKFILGILARGHESVVEHAVISASVICDRGVSHELVRHRLASYTQESTRFCNYSGGVIFCLPVELHPYKVFSKENLDGLMDVVLNTGEHDVCLFLEDCDMCERNYNRKLAIGWTPQRARGCLINWLKTDIGMTLNLREWRHFFRMRCAKSAHPDMRFVAKSLLKQVYDFMPVMFEDQYRKFIMEVEA